MGPREPDLPKQIKHFLEGWGISVSTNEAQIGKTKVRTPCDSTRASSQPLHLYLLSTFLLPSPLQVFMRDDHAHLLQQRLQEEVLDRIIMIQKWTRGNLARMRFLNMRRSALILQVWWAWHCGCGGCGMVVWAWWV